LKIHEFFKKVFYLTLMQQASIFQGNWKKSNRKTARTQNISGFEFHDAFIQKIFHFINNGVFKNLELLI